MTSYTIRIELHHGEGDFEKLHAAMKEKGFSKEIKAYDGTSYDLPPGEYSIESDKGSSHVLAIAKQAVAKTGHKGEILVTESHGRVWSGLHEHKRSA